MKKLLEDVLESGDVLELEGAIVSAQNSIITSPNFHQQNINLGDILLRCRKTLVKNLEVCKPLLKPLRRACRHFDEVELTNALQKIYCAPPEVRRYMRTDILEAEALRRRMLEAAEKTHRMLECTDWREVEHFLDANTAILPDEAVLALLRRREELLAQTRDKALNTTWCVPALTPTHANSTRRENKEEIHIDDSVNSNINSSLSVDLTLRSLLCSEESHRRALLLGEHTHRVLSFKSFMSELASLLSGANLYKKSFVQFHTSGEVSTPRRPPTMNTPSWKNVTDVDSRVRMGSSATTPNVSPIRRNSLNNFISKAENQVRRHQQDQISTVSTLPPTALTNSKNEDHLILPDAASSLRLEGHAVVSPIVWAELRAMMCEEDVHRRDVERAEDFERNVLLLPVAVQGGLLTRVLPGRLTPSEH